MFVTRPDGRCSGAGPGDRRGARQSSDAGAAEQSAKAARGIRRIVVLLGLVAHEILGVLRPLFEQHARVVAAEAQTTFVGDWAGAVRVGPGGHADGGLSIGQYIRPVLESGVKQISS